MSASNITSTLAAYSSLSLDKAQMQGTMTSSLLSALDNSSSSIGGLTDMISSGTSDLLSISAVGASLSALSKAATEAGVADAMPQVQLFVEQLQKDGTDNITILGYLNRAREMVKSDPAEFSDVFSGEYTATQTEDAIVSDESEDTEEAETTTETDTGAEEEEE